MYTEELSDKEGSGVDSESENETFIPWSDSDRGEQKPKQAKHSSKPITPQPTHSTAARIGANATNKLLHTLTARLETPVPDNKPKEDPLD